MTLLIQQRTPSDCAICCMAMLTGRSYEDVLAAVGDAFDPEKGMRYEQKALQRLGFSHAYRNGKPIGDISCQHRGYQVSPEYFLDFTWGRRALITVPSLNIADRHHMVYWDGNSLFDPNPPPKRTYERWDELKPDEIVLFRERR